MIKLKHLIILAITALFLVSCQQKQYVCSTGEVVLNSWECPTQKAESKYALFNIKVKAVVDDPYSLNSVDWTTTTNKETIRLKKIFLNTPEQGSYGILALHILAESQDLGPINEEIRCTISEYYNSMLNGKETIGLNKQQKGVQNYYFEANKKPKEVRFDVECKGIDSGYSNVESYYVDLIYLD